jgi:ankyrin repeat protein
MICCMACDVRWYLVQTLAVTIVLGCRRQPTPQPPNSLAAAAFSNDLAAAQRFIAAGANVNQPDGRGNVPLMLLGASHGTAMAELLLQHGADVNYRAPYGDTPLIAAVQANRADIVQRLISHGADVNQGNAKSQTPLMLAGVYPRVLRLLLDAGADVNARDQSGLTPINFVADLNLEAEMIARGANVNVEDVDHVTPLMGAIGAGNVEEIKFLSAHGARIDHEGSAAQRLLYDALRWPDTDRSLRALIELGVDINATDDDGNTVLNSPTIPFPDPNKLRWLLNAGIDFRRRNSEGYTPREWAEKYQNTAVAELLERYEKGLEHPSRPVTPATTQAVTTEPG